jgi:hypothetical protein
MLSAATSTAQTPAHLPRRRPDRLRETHRSDITPLLATGPTFTNAEIVAERMERTAQQLCAAILMEQPGSPAQPPVRRLRVGCP